MDPCYLAILEFSQCCESLGSDGPHCDAQAREVVQHCPKALAAGAMRLDAANRAESARRESYAAKARRAIDGLAQLAALSKARE